MPVPKRKYQFLKEWVDVTEEGEDVQPSPSKKADNVCDGLSSSSFTKMFYIHKNVPHRI